MKKSLTILAFLVGLSSWAFGAEINLSSLLDDMIDRSAIAKYPEPAFLCKQVSSYDRRSESPGNAGWFANDDWSNFIRCDEVDGRREWVLMDQDGPGVIVRWWITGFKYSGTLRVYLDGADTPVLQGKADKLIGGDLFLGKPLNEESSRGRNLYLPIPYRKHIKITYDGPNPHETKDFSENLYYNINYREYPKGTDVKTFSMDDFDAHKTKIAAVQKKLLNSDEMALKQASVVKGRTVLLGQAGSTGFDLAGPAAISRLMVKIESDKIEQALRSTIIKISFDGKECVWAPIGEFFGTGNQLIAYKSWWRQVTDDGWMICYWPMPFKDNAKIEIVNCADLNVKVTVGDISLSDWTWDDRTMCFHSSWRGDYKISVPGSDQSKIKDWNYITINGKGVYVGDTLAVFNRSAGADGAKWWGEGDEKVFVDGESFPSHIGTGTEDYYGYAWCCGDYFTSPFHAQPTGFGNQNTGHSTNTRIRILDSIPFTKKIQFDMEQWHWQATDIDYASTTYWYAFDGATANGMRSKELVAKKVGDFVKRIEGQAAQMRRCSGGYTQIQEGKWGATGGSHLWWTFGKTGDVLEVEFTSGEKGKFNASLQLLSAVDYGRFEVLLDGKTLLKEMDLYEPKGVLLKKVELGTIELNQGPHLLTFKILEKNPEAANGNMLGFDYLELKDVE